MGKALWKFESIASIKSITFAKLAEWKFGLRWPLSDIVSSGSNTLFVGSHDHIRWIVLWKCRLEFQQKWTYLFSSFNYIWSLVFACDGIQLKYLLCTNCVEDIRKKLFFSSNFCSLTYEIERVEIGSDTVNYSLQLICDW